MYDTTNTRFNYYLKTKACMDDFDTFESRFALITKQRANIYLSIDIWLDKKSLNISEKKFKISYPMYRIMFAFNLEQGRTLNKKFLLLYGWGPENNVQNNVTVAISELSLILRETEMEIMTIVGQGYRLLNMTY